MKKRDSLTEESYLLQCYDTLEDLGQLKGALGNLSSLLEYRENRVHSAEEISQIKLLEIEARNNLNYEKSRAGIRSGRSEKTCSLCGEQIFKSSFNSFLKRISFAKFENPSSKQKEAIGAQFLVMVPKYGLCHMYCAKQKSSKPR